MMNSSKFEIEVIASGDFLDNDPSFNGKTYRVATRTIRLNPIAMNVYLSCQLNLGIEDFDSREEYDEYETKKRLKKISFEKNVAEILGFDQKAAHVNIQQIVSEVFGVAYITEEK